MVSNRQIREIVEEAGCLFFGVVSLDEEPRYSSFSRWLERGLGAGMSYLGNHRQLRQDPRALLNPSAKVAVIIGLQYGSSEKTEHGPKVAKYARLKDYHKLMRKRGDRIGRRLFELAGQSFDSERFRVCVDSAPLLERALAERTALGFIGKNTCFIHPRLGSMFCLGELLFSFPLADVDHKELVNLKARGPLGGCGSCRRCQVHCPTGALDQDHVIDSRRCLSYWTIEHRGEIPLEFWPHLGRYWYGCDICQDVCPYNRSSAARRVSLGWETAVQDLDLYDVATMGQLEYERWFGGSPMVRAKLYGLKRNALIALYVTSDRRLEKALGVISKGETTTPGSTALLATVATIRKLQSRSQIPINRYLDASCPDRNRRDLSD